LMSAQQGWRAGSALAIGKAIRSSGKAIGGPYSL
jgi:hypothetical protein